jgi:uncharacterized membrane protein YfhO
LTRVFTDKTVDIYEEESALPRTFFATQWSLVPQNDALKVMLDQNFDPSKEILLEKDPGVKSLVLTGLSTVEYVSYSANERILTVKNSVPGILFTSETWYPGWKAYVDGKEVEILRADYSFRAIAVPEGTHTIRFVYKPLSFTVGAWLSLVTLIFTIPLYIYATKSKQGS